MLCALFVTQGEEDVERALEVLARKISTRRAALVVTRFHEHSGNALWQAQALRQTECTSQFICGQGRLA